MTERYGSSGRPCKKWGYAIKRKRTCFTWSVWAALCGRCGGANTSALAVLRGPIRRRPYNRGEIVAKKRGQLILLNDFYWCVDQSPSRGCTAERGADEAIRALAGSTWCNQLRRISSISTQLSPTGGCLHCLNAWQRPVGSRRAKQRLGRFRPSNDKNLFMAAPVESVSQTMPC